MTPIDIDPVGPVGSGSPKGRRRKPSGGVQAITMILAWVGGAAAAVAVAFWILQFVKPAPDPNSLANDRSANSKKDDQKIKPQPVKRKVVPVKREPVQPKSTKPLIDRENFQRPEMAGLTYRYYDGDSFGMSDFATATPSRSGVIVDLSDLPPPNEAKGLQLGGIWETKTEHPFDFLLDSTNGARVSIDGILILDNTAQFERKEVVETRTIESGRHRIQVNFILSNSKGSYKLEVGGAGDPNRWDLARLLQPFDSVEPKSIQTLQYSLAKYGKPVFAAKALIAHSRKAVESGSVETVSAKPIGDDESAKTIMPEGVQLLAGLAISPQDGRVAAVMPIYLNDSGLSLGETIGRKSARWEALIAKPGFAVSAVQIEQSDRADDVSVEFRRIDDKSLLPTDAYAQSLGSGPVNINVSNECEPVVGLRVLTSNDSRLLGVDAMRVRSSDESILAVLVDGFPTPPGLEKAPSPSVATKAMKKMMRESAERLAGKTGGAQLMEMRALAESTAGTARNAVSSDSQFVGLLEARRLYLLAGEFKPAFAIVDELSHKFDYDYWTDTLLFFKDAAKRASKSKYMQGQVVTELGPVIVKAEEDFEFEVAGKLAAGGKMLATEMKDQGWFKHFDQRMDEFESRAKATKLARVAAKTLASRPDDGKANRVMGVFSLVVTQDRDEAMKYFARSSNKDCEFIAENDQSFNGSDAEVAIKLADCWKRVGKKNDALEELAIKRAKKVLMEARTQAEGKSLKNIDADLERM